MVLEAAIVLPMLVLLTVAFVELIGLLWAKMAITNAAFEAARSAAVHVESYGQTTWIRSQRDAADMIVRVRCRESLGVTAESEVVSVSLSEDASGKRMVIVTVEAKVPLPLALGGLQTVTMRAVGKAPMEPYFGISVD
jgi:hypothetical protein